MVSHISLTRGNNIFTTKIKFLVEAIQLSAGDSLEVGGGNLGLQVAILRTTVLCCPLVATGLISLALRTDWAGSENRHETGRPAGGDVSTQWVRESSALSQQVAEHDVEMPQPDWGWKTTWFWVPAQGCAWARLCWPQAGSEVWGRP